MPHDEDRMTQVAPANLPPSHPDAILLVNIRKQTRMEPRWPRFHTLPVARLRAFGPAYSSIVVSHALRVIYIPVFKVATTSMMWDIAYLENNSYVLAQGQDALREAGFERSKGGVDGEGRDDEASSHRESESWENNRAAAGAMQRVLHDLGMPAWHGHTVYDMAAERMETLFADPSYLKFGFVRNPFSRLVSAYVDKVAGVRRDSVEYQRQMYALFGYDVAQRAAANESALSLREFVFAVERVLHGGQSSHSSLSSSSTTSGGDAGGDADVTYEDNSSRRDLHWRPQCELLHPDLIHVDFVGRFERLVTDRAVVLQWMYRHTSRRLPDAAARGSRLHKSNPEIKRSVVRKLRADTEVQEVIRRVYRDDFERFGISTEVPEDNEF